MDLIAVTLCSVELSLKSGMKVNIFHILFCFWLTILHFKGMISIDKMNLISKCSLVFTADSLNELAECLHATKMKSVIYLRTSMRLQIFSPTTD